MMRTVFRLSLAALVCGLLPVACASELCSCSPPHAVAIVYGTLRWDDGPSNHGWCRGGPLEPRAHGPVRLVRPGTGARRFSRGICADGDRQLDGRGVRPTGRPPPGEERLTGVAGPVQVVLISGVPEDSTRSDVVISRMP